MTKNRLERIKDILTKNLLPGHLEVRDTSYLHMGHAGAQPGGETHYEVIIEAECFREMTKVRRHQAIYRLLADEFKTGLHALAIETRAGGERP